MKNKIETQGEIEIFERIDSENLKIYRGRSCLDGAVRGEEEERIYADFRVSMFIVLICDHVV